MRLVVPTASSNPNRLDGTTGIASPTPLCVLVVAAAVACGVVATVLLLLLIAILIATLSGANSLQDSSVHPFPNNMNTQTMPVADDNPPPLLVTVRQLARAHWRKLRRSFRRQRPDMRYQQAKKEE